MSVYRLSHQAEQDLNEIADHIANYNPKAADDVVDALLRTLQTLAANSRIGQSRDDLRRGLHVFPAKRPAQNYIDCYFIIEGGIEVATVLHGRRDWFGLLERGDR
jgi:toxin ParE1/3/4